MSTYFMCQLSFIRYQRFILHDLKLSFSQIEAKPHFNFRVCIQYGLACDNFHNKEGEFSAVILFMHGNFNGISDRYRTGYMYRSQKVVPKFNLSASGIGRGLGHDVKLQIFLGIRGVDRPGGFSNQSVIIQIWISKK